MARRANQTLTSLNPLSPHAPARRAAGEHRRLDARFALVGGGDLSGDFLDAGRFDQAHRAAAEAAARHPRADDAALAADAVGPNRPADRARGSSLRNRRGAKSWLATINSPTRGQSPALIAAAASTVRSISPMTCRARRILDRSRAAIACRFELRERGVAQRRDAELPGGRFALAAALGIFAARQLVLHVAVDDQHRDASGR